jgi:hypothetical protein
MWRACAKLTFGGRGGSLGSTVASIKAGSSSVKRLRQNPLTMIGIDNRIPANTGGSGHAGIVDGLKIATIFRVPNEGQAPYLTA